MSALGVPLESIPRCFQGVIPSAFATSSANGIPNVSYVSMVHYVDADRVAISRQFLNKTAANLAENPDGQVLLVDPDTTEQYLVDLEYLRTEKSGAVFETVKENLEAVSAQTGRRAAWQLRGVDIHRVVACRRYREGEQTPRSTATGLPRDLLRALDEFIERIGGEPDVVAAADRTLEQLDELFGIRHGAVLIRDGSRLRPIAGTGAAGRRMAGAVEVGAGLVGLSAQRARVLSISNVSRGHVMAAAVTDGCDRDGGDLCLEGEPQSVAGVPLVVGQEVVGALYLESEEPGAFGPERERLLRIIGAHVGAILKAFASAPEGPRPQREIGARDGRIDVVYYQADDSVFAGGEYVIKGVPGRVLWKLLREHVAAGRVHFTNRELRLDESLELPPGNDNLDSRLLSLRRRLGSGDFGIRLQRIGRGQLELSLDLPLELSEVATSGPMSREPSLAV